MSYKEITTIEEAIKRYKHPFDISKLNLSCIPPELASGGKTSIELQAVVWSINNDDPSVPEWKPDFNNRNQEKWGPWATGGAPDGKGSGFSFDGSNYDWTYTNACGGARFALKDEPRSDHMKEHFPDLYKMLWLILD